MARNPSSSPYLSVSTCDATGSCHGCIKAGTLPILAYRGLLSLTEAAKCAEASSQNADASVTCQPEVVHASTGKHAPPTSTSKQIRHSPAEKRSRCATSTCTCLCLVHEIMEAQLRLSASLCAAWLPAMICLHGYWTALCCLGRGGTNSFCQMKRQDYGTYACHDWSVQQNSSAHSAPVLQGRSCPGSKQSAGRLQYCNCKCCSCI